MADEAVIIELLGNPPGLPRRFTVSNAVNVSKGAILVLSDPNTASASTTAYGYIAGIAAADKVANDGSTTLSLYTYGKFGLKASGAAVTAGRAVIHSGSNLIAEVANPAATVTSGGLTAASMGVILGQALSTAAGGTAETIPVLVGPRFV